MEPNMTTKTSTKSRSTRAASTVAVAAAPDPSDILSEHDDILVLAGRQDVDVKALFGRSLALEALTKGRTAVTTASTYGATGAVVVAALRSLADDKASDLHTVPQAVCDKALDAFGLSMPKGEAKLRVRAFLYCTPERLAAAATALAADDPKGPRNGRVTSIIQWCQAFDAKGRATMGSNRQGSTNPPPRTEREAVERVSKARADATSAAARAEREAAKVAADDAWKRAKTNSKLGGILTKGDIQAATDDALRATIVAIEAALRAR